MPTLYDLNPHLRTLTNSKVSEKPTPKKRGRPKKVK